MNCRYHDEENGWCKLHSDWSTAMPEIEYCVEGPCPDESPITNRDSIRSMSAEEMVAFLMDFKDCSNCIIGRGKKDCYKICDSTKSLADWLNSPAEGSAE